jgi:5-methylthioadenosine/S-adenosylhomocysteine deaminase
MPFSAHDRTMTRQLLLCPGTIITMDPDRRVIRDGAVLIQDSSIARVLDRDQMHLVEGFTGERMHLPELTLIPGFVQTHIHLCQTLFRGLADDLELLDWLRLKIYPFEAAHDGPSMYVSALLGIAELVSSGTTTIMDMGSIHHEEEIVRAVEESGLRAHVGKSLMDVNPACPRMREPTGDALASALDQARTWHKSAEGRILYSAAPRFVLSCSESLLRDAWAMTRDFPGMLFHTHAAENPNELQAVQEQCGMGNVEYFDHCGVLRENTCLAHAVWLNDHEFDLIAQRRARVLHCPSSNLKLGSGIAQVPRMLRTGITVSLGADGAPCNNMLNMFEEMRLASLIQKPLHGAAALPADEVFALATIGGAVALGMDQNIGSIEPGKKGDVVLLNTQTINHPYRQGSPADLYSAIVYSGSPANVHSVMVDGRWLYRNGEFVALDRRRLVEQGREALGKLLRRV